MVYCGLIMFSIVVTLGGMKVIGYTDVIQVLVLMIGGLITTYLVLNYLSEKFGYGNDILQGAFCAARKSRLSFSHDL